METSTDTTRSKPESGSDGEASRGTSGNGATGTRRKLSDQQEAEVTRLYAQTDTPVSEISKRFGIGESSVYRVAQRHGAALRGRTSTPAKSTPRAAAAAKPAAAATTTTTPRATGTRGRAAAGSTPRAARAAAAPSGNGRRTGARRAAAAATTGRRAAPAAAAAATPRAAAGSRREFRVSFVAVRVFAAVDMADAIRQAEAAGATDITGIVRN